jgi:tRNA(Ile)-lysidine synthase
LSGIHPTVEFPEGQILRPLLSATRAEVEACLIALGQGWREDLSNADRAYTRNRIRHELLPLLEGWNPRLREHMAQMAALAKDEEAWWQAEMARLAPQLLMEGRAVRGGGRAAGAGSAFGLALDVTRLAALAPAVQRRLLRYAAEQMGAKPDFVSTEALRTLALSGRAGQKCELAQGLRAERTPRELRLSTGPRAAGKGLSDVVPEYYGPIPGEMEAPAFGIRLMINISRDAAAANDLKDPTSTARLRNWRPGDRVRLRYSSKAGKVKEVLERMRVTGSSRVVWPVLEVDGHIVWMKGVEVEPERGIEVVASPLEGSNI